MIHFSPEAADDLGRVREFLAINNPEAAKRALRASGTGAKRASDMVASLTSWML